MDGLKACPEGFADAVQVMQIGAGEMAAGVAITGFGQGRGVVAVRGIFDMQHTYLRVEHAVACRAGRQLSVEHIYALLHGLDNIDRGAHAHQIARFVGG